MQTLGNLIKLSTLKKIGKQNEEVSGNGTPNLPSELETTSQVFKPFYQYPKFVFFNLKKAYFHLKQFYNYIFDAPTTQCEEGYRNGRFSNALTIQLGSKNFREMKLKLFANSTSLDTSRNKMSHGFSLYNIRKGQDDQKSEIPLRS